uniref:Tetratricopeptide repeat-containing protein n=1 Tax=Candidatus Kentrum sp. FW TaxID=2126338 RepID=A0A450TP20_9GAMM|nr:MAG: Tetratricopeptide repeat-containing protein [Candidatus Kentron sp. FW]
MNLLMDALRKAKDARWDANPRPDAPHGKPDSPETYSRKQSPSPDHESAWSLLPITPPPVPEQAKPELQKPPSIPVSGQIGNRRREPNLPGPSPESTPRPALIPGVPGQEAVSSRPQSHGTPEDDAESENNDGVGMHRHRAAWEATPIAKKNMARRRYRGILLFGVLPLFLSGVVAGIYVLGKVAVHEAYAIKELTPAELTSSSAEPVMLTHASVMEPAKSAIGSGKPPNTIPTTPTPTNHPQPHARTDARIDRSVIDIAVPEETAHGAPRLSGSTMEHRFGKAFSGPPIPESLIRPEEKRTFLAANSSDRKIPEQILEDAPRQIDAETPPGQIEITRTRAPDLLHAMLVTGFNAFKNGDSATADTAYRNVLKEQPDNRDALLGLAALAMREQRWEIAANHYFRILRRNSKDIVAQAALLEIRDNLDPAVAETGIKELLQKEPGAPYLHFSLGNLYARQSRWFEAEKAYFNAYRADNANADYSYNLAVSLDHLARQKAALTYYRRALELASGQSRPTGFDPVTVLARIETIEK